MKRLLVFVLIFALVLNGSSVAVAKEIEEKPVLVVDDKKFSTADTAYFNGVPYIVAVTCLAHCSTNYDVMKEDEELQVMGSFGKSQVYALSAVLNNKYVNINGRYLYVGMGVKKIGEHIALPFEIFATLYGGTLTKESAKSDTYFLELGKYGLMLGSKFYSESIVDIMAHTIYSEAGNQCLEGKIAVGNVIMRRVKSKSFPNSVYQVVHSGIQFEGVHTERFNEEPNESCYIAAKIALEGTEMLPGAMYFNTVDLDSWARRSRTYLGTIQGHDFFA